MIKRSKREKEREREKEHQDLYWFTLPQGLRPILFQTSKEFY